MAEYVQAEAVPPVATKLPPSTERVVDVTLISSEEVPERLTVVVPEIELSEGVEMVVVGGVTSSCKSNV